MIDLLDIDSFSEAECVKELIARGGLHEFMRQFWHVVEPRDFVDNWHFGALAEFLEALYYGQIKRGVINIAPGLGKSLTTGVMFPSWIWSKDPGYKQLAGSYDLTLMHRDAEKVSKIVSSQLYQECYPKTSLVDGCAMGSLQTTGNGLILSITVQGKGTGWHGDMVRVDDPVKALEARAKGSVANRRSIEWYHGTLANRRVDPANFRFLLTMQRVSKDDLAGELLDHGFEHLCLPMHYAPKALWIKGDWSAKLDKRTEPGELLFPARFDEATVKDLEKSLGTPSNINAQCEQNPTPDTGGIIERAWLRTYRELPGALTYVGIWDLNFKGSKSSHSMVVGNLFAFGNGWHYLVSEVRGMFNYPMAKEAYIDAQKLPYWRDASLMLVEAKANGSALCDDIRAYNSEHHTTIIEPREFEPLHVDKSFRLGLRSTMIKGGLLLIPEKNEHEPQETDWLYDPQDGWIQEIVGFPFARKDDRADCLSAYLNWVSENASTALRWADGSIV